LINLIIVISLITMKKGLLLHYCLCIVFILTFNVKINAQTCYTCDTYNTGGSYNWVCPPGVTSVTVQCWGGGGGGGGVSVVGTISSGSGGAGGSFAQGTSVAVTPGNTYVVVTGAGGSGAVGSAGSAGGSSSFGGSTVVAVGGGGGNLGNNGNGAAVAGSTTGNIGTVSHAGGNSVAGSNAGAYGSGGGGGAGTTAVGGNGSTYTGGTGGATGGGAGGNGAHTTAGAGSNGISPGGGGGGAYSNLANSSYSGGDGADGEVIICYNAPICSGTPTAGTATASVTSYSCSGGYSTISLSGSSSCGITYQWQSSPNNSTWTNIGGATSSTYTATVNTTTYYHCVLTCTVSASSSSSTSIQVASTSTVACYTCYDGIQNGTETGVDCGGTCPLSCSTNTATVSSACTCPAASSATVYSTTCAQVGTSAFDLNSPIADFTGCAATAPSSLTCSVSATTDGAWVHVTLGAGVTQVQMSLSSGSMGSGSSACYAAAYQGASCASLSQVGGCQETESFSAGTYGAYNVIFSGLNPAQDLWVYMYNNNNKAFDLNFQMIGTVTAPSNTTCATASTATGAGCNLGATGASFTPPSAAGASPACSGGTWFSNENTVFFSFTPTATTASLSINTITCDNGTTGTAQFAVWTSCAAIGTYTSTSTYLGCAVGTGTISLSGLTIGQTYYIASDGNAGSDCKWDFAATNIIILPVELLNFHASVKDKNVELRWTTSSEENNKYFTIERSKDATSFEYVTDVPGAGNSTTSLRYNSMDTHPYEGISYYRLKQTDYDGNSKYSYIISVEFKFGAIGEIQVFYPSPNLVTFNVNCDPDREINYMIYDVTGKEMTSGKFVSVKGVNQIQVPVEGFANGIYFITLTDGETQKQQKFIKY
jgi:hypothetical protein